eukprot:5715287-Amphidinium_carterae.3
MSRHRLHITLSKGANFYNESTCVGWVAKYQARARSPSLRSLNVYSKLATSGFAMQSFSFSMDVTYSYVFRLRIISGLCSSRTPPVLGCVPQTKLQSRANTLREESVTSVHQQKRTKEKL